MKSGLVLMPFWTGCHMTYVLDAGGVSALALDRTLLDGLLRRNEFPAEVASVVLTEALTGDHRRDHATNRVLGLSMVRPVSEPLARRAATLRTSTGCAGTISAVDACVVALAEATSDPTVLTSDSGDIAALVAQSDRSMKVRSV